MKRAVRRYGGRAVGFSRSGAAIAALEAVLLTALPPYRLTAQDSPAIRDAVRLAAEGRGDSARALVNAALARSRPGDPAHVEALYWRARLATLGDSAERDLRRIAIEYPGSKYADHALLQLSQLALAAGNPVAALELAARLRSDYPLSALRARAALWAGRSAFEVGEPPTACAYLDTASGEGASDIEFLNQVRFYRSRCTEAVLAAPPPRPDTARALARAGGDSSAAPANTPAAPPAPRGTGQSTPSRAEAARGFDVQVAAARNDREAQAILRRLGRNRRDAHVVIGTDGLRRVRVGPFPSLPAADSAARALRRHLGGSPFPVRLP